MNKENNEVISYLSSNQNANFFWTDEKLNNYYVSDFSFGIMTYTKLVWYKREQLPFFFLFFSSSHTAINSSIIERFTSIKTNGNIRWQNFIANTIQCLRLINPDSWERILFIFFFAFRNSITLFESEIIRYRI